MNGGAGDGGDKGAKDKETMTEDSRFVAKPREMTKKNPYHRKNGVCSRFPKNLPHLGKHNPQALLSKIPKKKEEVGTTPVQNHKKRIGLIFDR